MKHVWYIVGIIVVFVIASRLTRMVFIGNLKIRYGNAKETISSGVPGARRALLVYQPAKSGSTKRIVRRMAERIRDAGYDVDLSQPGRHLPTDLSGYSLVAFGSPVYTGVISPVLTGYMKSTRGLPEGKVIVFSVGMADGQAPELETLKDALPGVKAALALKFHYKTDGKNSGKYDAVYGLAKE